MKSGLGQGGSETVERMLARVLLDTVCEYASVTSLYCTDG